MSRRGRNRGNSGAQGQQGGQRSGFYMVWRQGGNTPTRQYNDLGSAQQEATRLASQNQGKKFFVLQAVKAVQITQASVYDLSRPRGQQQRQGQARGMQSGITPQSLNQLESLIQDLRSVTQQEVVGTT